MFNRRNVLIILIVLIVVILPIVLAIVFGKIQIKFPFFNQTTPTANTPLKIDTSKVALYCPSINAFCANGQMITSGDNILGYGRTLKSGSPVKTAFNGVLTFSQTTLGDQTLQTVRLENTELKTTAIYYFVGNILAKTDIPSSPNGYVKADVRFGTVTQEIAAYKISLLFQLFVGNDTVPQQLQTNSFILSQ